MNLSKHLPTFARLFSRKPWSRWSATVPPQYALPEQTPATAKETPRKRPTGFYIPTNESPWCIISHEKGRWIVALYYIWGTRQEARMQARKYSIAYGVPTRVVRAIIPTR